MAAVETRFERHRGVRGESSEQGACARSAEETVCQGPCGPERIQTKARHQKRVPGKAQR